MDHRTVKRLEEELEKVIEQWVQRQPSDGLPIEPSLHTIHLMAKAAATVYEAVVDNQRR